jgi:ABC-type Na+ efflux pump permease subunit
MLAVWCVLAVLGWLVAGLVGALLDCWLIAGKVEDAELAVYALLGPLFLLALFVVVLVMVPLSWWLDCCRWVLRKVRPC